MESVLLIVLAAVFGYLAYDAWQLSVDAGDVTYEVLSGESPDHTAGIPRAELNERKRQLLQSGERNFHGAHWFWVLAMAVCLGSAVWRWLA